MNFVFIVLHMLFFADLTLAEVFPDCQPGYHFGNGKCLRNCENCDKGNCTELGICQRCNPKYVLSEGICIPLCRHKCINGFCASPNTCQCNEGYLENPKTKSCESACTTSCGDNAYCSSPNECTCNHGFNGDPKVACQPWCKAECKNGQCIGPDKCECYQGFVKMRGVCIHDCPTCAFGDCSNEGICICWPDLYFNKLTGSCQYEPVDDTKTLLITTLSTSYPELTTKELHNYTLPPMDTSADTESDISTTSEFSAIPTSEFYENCANGCWGGTCLNGVCQCQEGLILSEDTNECLMPCENTCQNGICNQGKICECYQGYIHHNTSGCIPKCDQECINSHCVAPTSCECFQGDISKFNFSSGHECLPTCAGIDGNERCQNGTCVAVNRCECFKGFVSNPDNRFECLEKMDSRYNYRRILLYSLLTILLLALIISISLIYLLCRKTWKVSYDVRKQEKCNSIMFRNIAEPQCLL